MIIPLTPAKKKPRYRARVVVYWSIDWHQLCAAGWNTHRVLVYAGGDRIATMCRRLDGK